MVDYNTRLTAIKNLTVSNIVEIRDLVFGYGDREILSGINMTFPKGKVVAIMGGSGSGKTTILRLIGGQLIPKSGDVTVDGEVVQPLETTSLYRLRRKMGSVVPVRCSFH